MRFALIQKDIQPRRDAVAAAVVRACLAHGHTLSGPDDGIRFVLNLTDPATPRAFRRRAQSVFVFSFIALDRRPGNLRALCYETLVRTLSNVLLCAVPGNENAGPEPGLAWDVCCTTPEAGFYVLPVDGERIYERLAPIAGAHFAIGNNLAVDLPERLWETSPIVEDLKAFGRKLDSLGVLPAPFPLRDFLSEDQIRHIYAIFEMTGLSYGNLSAREAVPETGPGTFWMTARGADKARLAKIGKDILLVAGIDAGSGRIRLSLPPGYWPRARVSVDAVEHELIYRTFPEVGAIVHVHAWMDGVPCTHQNYPCGTRELAEDVVALLRTTSAPGRAEVGLKNHGLTLTGPCLEDIFSRLRGRLRTQVEMAA
ncbi:MAG: class II aldolase/adducin family protein [Candidatus Aminicenantales bacterium]|jgi:ribulose-5-phosphate 4-epimerase/fuculose-1-phosphate aldolase